MHDYQRFCWLYAVPGPVCIVQAHVLIGREDAERASCDWSVETDSLPEMHPVCMFACEWYRWAFDYFQQSG